MGLLDAADTEGLGDGKLTATQKIDPSAIPRTTIVIPQKRPATITSKDFQKKANSNAIWISIIAVLLMIIGVMLYKFMTK